MKLLALILVLVAGFVAHAQDDKATSEKTPAEQFIDNHFNKEDPNMSIGMDEYTQASAVDTTGTFQGVVSKLASVKTPQSCPSCNLHRQLDSVDENGDISSSEKSTPSTGDEQKAQK